MNAPHSKIKSSVKFKNWFMNRAIKAQWIHRSMRTRKWFTKLYWMFILTMLVLYCGASILLFMGGVRFYSDGPDPNNHTTNWYAISVKHEWALATGLMVLIVLFIITFLAGLYIPILYKQSKILYFQSDEYKQNVIKYANTDLKKYSILKIKWLKKLGYIDKVRYSFYKNKPKKIKK